MSFSSEIRSELGKIANVRPCCIRAAGGTSEYVKGLKDRRPNVLNKCCKKAALREAFMLAGSVSDPEKSYHLEIVFRRKETAEFILSIMNALRLNPKTTSRNEYSVVYVKEGEGIVDFLNITGAHNALMTLENVRILKDMRNSVNREVNCETANLDKMVNASLRQVGNIRYLEEHVGFDNLPVLLKEIAELRMEFSEISLKELGQLLNPPLGKSGVNHRLRKLDRLAEAARASLHSS